MSIVDISSKNEHTRRETYVTALVRLLSPPAREIDSIRDSIRRVFEYSCHLSWILLPLLHPLALRECKVNMTLHGTSLRIDAYASAIYKTGVEMDTLIGLAGLIASLPLYLNCELEIESIRVERKVKIEHELQSNMGHLSEISLRGILDIEKSSTRTVEVEAEGRIALRQDTIEKILKGKIEKGNVIEFARVCALRNLKMLPVIMSLAEGYCQVPLLQGAHVELDVLDSHVHVRLHARFMSGNLWLCYGCGLFSVLSGLLTVWDMVKKYEKDEEGQYRYTEIKNVRVLLL